MILDALFAEITSQRWSKFMCKFMLVDDRGRRHLVEAGVKLDTDRGIYNVPDDVKNGICIESHSGNPGFIISPSLTAYVAKMERPTRIPHFEDIGYVLAQAGLREGQTVIEAGTGSGACALFFSQAVGEAGRVISFERREDILQAAKRNIAGFGCENIELVSADLRTKPDDLTGNLVFLDLASPSEYLALASRSVDRGGAIAAHVAFLEEASRCLVELEELGLEEATMTEIIRRDYEVKRSGTRPRPTQTVYTGYIVLGRYF
jgi:tRNA (adenine57-N1/adenine58-N1)-methyltransferase